MKPVCWCWRGGCGRSNVACSGCWQRDVQSVAQFGEALHRFGSGGERQKKLSIFRNWDRRNVTISPRVQKVRQKSRVPATSPSLLSGRYLMPNGNAVGTENKRPTREKQSKKPYTKPAFRFERVFETQALRDRKSTRLNSSHLG